MVKGVVLFMIIAWLFYNSWFAVFALPFFVIGFLIQWRKDCCKKKETEFCIQFRDGMRSLAASLRAGYSVENALREALRDVELIHGKEARFRKELYHMVRQMDMNVSAEDALRGFAQRVPQEDVESFVTVFVNAGRYGGDGIAVIQNTIKVLCDKMEVRQEIQVLLAAKQFEFKVMTMIPFGIIFYMRLAFTDFMDVLYGNVLGVLVMSICLVLYLAAWILGKRIVEIEI